MKGTFIICPRCANKWPKQCNWCKVCGFEQRMIRDGLMYSFTFDRQFRVVVHCDANVSVIKRVADHGWITWEEMIRVPDQFSPKMTREELDKYLVLL